ncbi:MAG TPA: tetratricopeptide repeat protein [Chloroflexia bacterium]|nr:tetratricopeptide repeat protein [Chloroflexia bacterium]
MSGEKFSTQQPTILELMRQGINLARSGDRAGAENVFESVLEQRPNHEEALVWKAAVVADASEAVRCLEKALRLNPENKRARVGLEWANKRLQGENPRTSQTQESHAQPGSTNAIPKGQPYLHSTPDSTANLNFNANFLTGADKISAQGSKLENETKAEPAPYKKHRIAEKGSGNSSVDLPPEAIPWTRPPKTLDEKRAAVNPPPDVTAESPVFRAASPRVGISVSPQVAEAARGKKATKESYVPLRWPLWLFGLALLLGVLSFPLHGIAPLLGILALGAALTGIVMFNRANF